MTDEDKTQLQDVKKTVAAVSLDPLADSALSGQLTTVETPARVDDGLSSGFAYAANAEQEKTIASSALNLSTHSSPIRETREDSSREDAALANVSSSHLAVGDVLKGRFQILEVLGEGGMGVVFKAVDVRKLEAKSRNPYVAIKVLNPALAKNNILVAGLQRECEKAQELSHPNIITVYDFDRDSDHVFMSMEYLVGRPLSKLIREANVSGGIELERAWPIIRKMGEALAYAHKKNIVHSDFKPANVFVTDKDEVKVLDFGIASRLGQSDTDETVFDARSEGGLTPPYASFEMLNGSRADRRDDIYAFGLVVYEILTGRHPYERKPASKVFLEQRGGYKAVPRPVHGLSRKQWQLLKSAIEILQEQRPKNLDEWLQQFDPSNRSKWLYPVVGSVAGLLIGAAGFLFFQWDSRTSSDSQQTLQIPNKVNSLPTAVQDPTKSEPPLSDAGSNLQAQIGEAVVLNGGLSRSYDGSPLKYAWRMTAQPAGSNSVLLNADTAAPQFMPDQAGSYTAELVVTDAGNIVSKPATVAINVERLVQTPVQATKALHESTSTDGVLYLAASKPNYHIGEELELSFSLAKAGYLRVAYVSTTGEISELLPNKYQPSKVKSDVTYRIPPKANSFKLQVTGPIGVDKVVAIFSESPIPHVKTIANADGSIVNQLQSLAGSSVTIQYDVLNKAR